MELTKRPYQLSIWGDRTAYIIEKNGERSEVFDLAQTVGEGIVIKNEVSQEYDLGRIASDDMVSPISAFNIRLTRNLNGTNELKFDLLYQYYDDEDDAFKDNPFLGLLVNERKVKLHFDDEWIHFIIKTSQKDSKKGIITYTCVDQYLNELAKTGYDIELNTELQNNMGSASQLGEYILKGSEWRIDTAKCESIKQKNVEPLVLYTLSDGIRATDVENEETELTLSKGASIWAFYSDTSKKQEKVQFFYSESGSFDNRDGIITNATHWEVAFSDLPNIEKETPNSDYLGEKLCKTQKTKFLRQIGEYCKEWKKQKANNPGQYETYYSYQKTKYLSESDVQELLINNANFNSTLGWNARENSNASISLVQSNKVDSFAQCLKIKPKDPENPSWRICNSGFKSHAALIQKLDVGQSFVLAIKLGAEKANPQFGLALTKYKNSEASAEENYLGTATELVPPKGTPISKHICIKVSVIKTVPYETLLQDNVFLELTGAGETTIEDVQVFRYLPDPDSNSFLYPDMAGEVKGIVSTKQYLVAKSDINEDTTADNVTITGEYDSEKDIRGAGYEEVYGDTPFEKISSIEGSKSNRFNLIQQICETFECWAKFDISTNSRGKIQYTYKKLEDPTQTSQYKRYYVKVPNTPVDSNADIDYNLWHTDEPAIELYERVAGKTIYFKEYIGDKNPVGFRYGINLDNIQRTIESDQIVSKTIVQPNSNEFAPDGICTIQRAPSNPIGENFILNFDYYIITGMLKRADLNRDLYGGGIGYYTRLQAINQSVMGLVDELAGIGRTLDSLISKQQVYSSQVKESEIAVAKAKEDLVKAGEPEDLAYDETNNNDFVNAACKRRDLAAANKTLYATKKNAITEKVTKYQAKKKSVQTNLDTYRTQKDVLNSEFAAKYSRFISEGTWVQEKYYDNEQYYLDASVIGRTSAFPKIKYRISVLDLSQVQEYSPYHFKIGDKTYIQDVEFFGKDKNGRPNKEEIIISKIEYNLDDPSKNVITVQNYKTQFEDLFQRMAASTTSLQFHEGDYNRAGSAISPDGTISSKFLKNSLSKNIGFIQGAPNGELVIDQDKGIITLTSDMGQVALNSLGITIGNGSDVRTAISSQGINADVITTGRLNTGMIAIYNSDTPTFVWNGYGLNAYAQDKDGKVNYNSFVRFNKYGIFSYAGDPHLGEDINPDDEKLKDNINFKLTKEGLKVKGDIYANQIYVKKDGTKYSPIIDDNNKINHDVLDLGDITIDGVTGTIILGDADTGITINKDSGITMNGSITWGTPPVDYIYSMTKDGVYNENQYDGTTIKPWRKDVISGVAGMPYKYIGTDGKNGEDGADADLSVYGITSTVVGRADIKSPYIIGGTILGGKIYASATYNDQGLPAGPYLEMTQNGIKCSLENNAEYWITCSKKPDVMGNVTFTALNCYISISSESGVRLMDVQRLLGRLGYFYGTGAEPEQEKNPQEGQVYFQVQE